MKNLKNKIAALVCGLALLCGVTYIATANKNFNCYSISVNACGESFSTVACGNGMTLLDATDLARKYIVALCK